MTRRTSMRIAFVLSLGTFGFLCWMVAESVTHVRPLWAIFWLVFATGVWTKVHHDWDELRAMRHPVPPTNVRLVTDEGTHPVACTYQCFDGDVHHWQIIAPDWLTFEYVMSHQIIVHCDLLPPHTVVTASVTKSVEP